MSSLTAIFGGSSENPEEDSEKLLELYWNRAELKKEFADLRNEKFRLQDRIKEQEAATARVHQKLNHIEQLLLDPEWVYSVIVHYQLQQLNQHCQSKLEKFAEQLKQQREQREHGRLLEEWKSDLRVQAADIEREIGEQRMQIQMLEDQLQTEQQRLVSMNGFVRFFRRRSITAKLDDLASQIDATQQQEQDLLMRYDELEHTEPPDTQGLDIPTKRLINYMILAFAQQMYLHYREDDLIGMLKETAEKSLGAVNYGGKKDCDRLLGLIQKRLNKFEKASDFADTLRQRAKLIAESAVYGGDNDAVPVAASVSTVFEIAESGAVKTRDANLLGENFWNLNGFVSR